MFSHIMVGANDVEASKKFYDATLGALGIPFIFKSSFDNVTSVFHTLNNAFKVSGFCGIGCCLRQQQNISKAIGSVLGR